MKIKSSSKLLGWLFRKINLSPFDGTIVLKFEKNPHYSNSFKKDHINAVYFKIFGTFFVSRILWDGNYLPERLALIKNANMLLGYVVVNTGNGEHLAKRVGLTIEEYKKASGFKNYICGVFNFGEKYLFEIKHAYNYARQGYKADRVEQGILFHPINNAYHGMNQRLDGATFKLGDKIFEPEWLPTKDNIKWEWVVKFCKRNNKRIPLTVDEFTNTVSMKKLVEYIPFRERGDMIITSLSHAKTAAKNVRDYLKV